MASRECDAQTANIFAAPFVGVLVMSDGGNFFVRESFTFDVTDDAARQLHIKSLESGDDPEEVRPSPKLQDDTTGETDVDRRQSP